MADVFVVETRYNFSGNHLRVLGEIADLSADVAKGLRSAARAANGMAKAFERVPRIAPSVQTALRDLSTNTTKLTVAFDSVGSASTAAAARAAAGFEEMGAASVAAADEVDRSAGSMISRLRAVQAATVSTSRAMQRLNVSASGGGRPRVPSAPSGVGAAAGAPFSGRAAGVVSGALDAASLASLVTMAAGVKTAANFQAAASQTGVAMGLPTATVERMFRPIAMAMSNATAQSMTDTMGMIQSMATSGFNDPKDLLANNGALPMAIARFADTQFLGAHSVGFKESVMQAATLAHQLGTRSASELEPMLNTLFKISQDMPDSLKTAATQIKFYGGQYRNAGVAPDEILQLQATADRLGLGGGRSGTGFRALLASLQNPSSDKMLEAQMRMGLIDNVRTITDARGKRHRTGTDRFIDERTGAFDPEGLFRFLNQRYNLAKRAGTVGEFNRTLAGISTSGAAPVLSLLSSDAGREQRAAVAATLSRVANLQQAQVQLIDNLNGQTKNLITNFENLASVIASPLIRPLTDLVANLARMTGGTATYLQSHPQQSAVLTAAVAAGSVLGAFKLVKMLGGFGIIFRAMEHEAKSHVGVGVYGSIRHRASEAAKLGSRAGAATVGRGIFGGAVDMLSLNAFRSVRASFAPLIGDLRTLGFSALKSRGGVLLLGETFGKLGLRLVPLLGEVLLIKDALWLTTKAMQSFSAHSFDIGKALGKASLWIQTTGGPQLTSAVTDAFKNLGPAIVRAVGTALQQLADLTDPMKWAESAIKNGQSLAAGFSAGRYGADPSTLYAPPPGLGLPAPMGPLGALSPAAQRQVNAARGGGAGGRSVVVNGDVHVHGVQNPRDFGAALHDHRSVNAAAGASPVTALSPAFSTTGIGRGR